MTTINTSQLISSYSALIKRTETSLQSLPNGKLYAQINKRKYPQYYLATDNKAGNTDRKYLRKSEQSLAKQLAQREYDENLLLELEKQLSTLKNVDQIYNPTTLLQVYENLPPAKKLLVQPRILPDDQFLNHWFETNPGGQNTYPFQESFLTERGELVRSKSEKIIADKLFLKGIPYQYETSLPVKKHESLYPDFTVLNTRTRKTYYYEHFGKMDDPDYCRRTLEKISLYQKNGYELGNQFIFTMESSQKAIDLQLVDLLINRYFL